MVATFLPENITFGERIFGTPLLKRNPKAVVIDCTVKEKDLGWIDKIEEFDAFID